MPGARPDTVKQRVYPDLGGLQVRKIPSLIKYGHLSADHYWLLAQRAFILRARRNTHESGNIE
jgi:hypothetical protein